MTGWDEARALAARWAPLPAEEVPLRDAVGAVLAGDVRAAAPVPHYDSAAMDGFAVTGLPPWRLGATAAEVVTGGLLPAWAEAVLPVERAARDGDRIDGVRPSPGAHLRRAGEEAPAGAVLATAGMRLSPAHVAVLGIAGVDAVPARRRPAVVLVLTGDEVDRSGRPAPGRVRDAFDPMLPLAVERLGGRVADVVRTGDDEEDIARAVARPADVVVTVGGTGRSSADRLRRALALLPGDAAPLFDGVDMRPGHPGLLTRIPPADVRFVGDPAPPAPDLRQNEHARSELLRRAGSSPPEAQNHLHDEGTRALLGLPGNPLAAVAVLLSFLPPVLDALGGAAARPLASATTAEVLPGWRGTSLIPCARTEEGLRAAPAARPNMLRGLAASDVLAVVPPEGAAAGDPVRVLPLPW